MGLRQSRFAQNRGLGTESLAFTYFGRQMPFDRLNITDAGGSHPTRLTRGPLARPSHDAPMVRQASRPSRLLEFRRLARVLGHILLAVALINLGACQPPAAASNLVLRILNSTSSQGSFQWKSPGVLGTSLFGDSGNVVLQPCREYDHAFGKGEWTVKIESDTSSISIVIRSENIQDYDAYAIRPDGQIVHLSAQEARVPPTICPG
jgi:hypothetical protein